MKIIKIISWVLIAIGSIVTFIQVFLIFKSDNWDIFIPFWLFFGLLHLIIGFTLQQTIMRKYDQFVRKKYEDDKNFISKYGKKRKKLK